MKRVLVITYYWPPSGGSGVQRCLKFVKYLRQYGWEPLVLTVKNPDYPVYDYSLENEIPPFVDVLKVPAWEPYKFYRFFTDRGNRKTNIGFVSLKKKESLLERFSVWIRGNLFIPDARKFWIDPSIRFLKKYLRENPVDVIFSSGPPHSAHLIAKKLKEHFNLPWVADFRDPWTGVYYYKKLRISSWADRKHKELEKSCLDAADCLITVNSHMKEDFEKITNTRTVVVTNGYDPEDFSEKDIETDHFFRIVYAGMFLKDQNAPELWEVLGEMTEQTDGFREKLRLVFAGKTDQLILDGLDRHGLIEFLDLKDYVPHSDLTDLLMKSSILLLSINRTEQAKAITTGKIFEYLAAGRPILAFCPRGSDAEKIIQETNAGYVIPFGQKSQLRDLLDRLFLEHQAGTLKVEPKNLENYSRKRLTGSLTEVFDELTKQQRKQGFS